MTWVCGCATKFIGTTICVADVETGFIQLSELSRLIAKLRAGREEPVPLERIVERFPAVA